MNFQLDEEQGMFKDTVRRLMDDNCSFDMRSPVITAGSFNAAHWQLFAEQGLLGLALPQSCDGLGYSAIETALVMEEMGRVLFVEPYWAIAVLAGQTLLASKDKRYFTLLRGLSSGEIKPVLAHEEFCARGRLSHVSTRAKSAGPGAWVLNGQKNAVIAGNIADKLIISARTAGNDEDTHGISLFLVDPSSVGLTIRSHRLVDNRWATEIDISDLRVTEETLVGGLNQGFPALEHAHTHALVALCAEAVGVMERAMWITRDYLKIRKQFGQPLSNFQSLQHRMSEMLIEVELSRGMVHMGLASLDRPAAERSRALSAMKAHIGKSGQFVCGQAIQLHGGIGVTEEYSIGHYFKRMTLINTALGSALFHHEQLAAMAQHKPAKMLEAIPA
ncbi:MAG TPA: acyl-CoA dehydrogenase [Pseudomonas xinjiangensis]|uniref:Acyl-CoA dehydrogenase n=2 Tax=root TaxID=1 RepID=A0A7V1FR46_9GAMM|nr:acyl-CoA dehydrogenase [Halopseudomonas xinjiangensis]HEC47559.1 acyl-CoA dehydrogenase [Halopseudomonas xinjiangensis]